MAPGTLHLHADDSFVSDVSADGESPTNQLRGLDPVNGGGVSLRFLRSFASHVPRGMTTREGGLASLVI